MILGVVVDRAGRPICSEMWPGNVADVSVLLPMVDRLRSRFGVGRVCVVADRGMISAATIAALEERGLEYVLGVRERTDKRIAAVLADGRPLVPIAVPRAKGETLLEAKEVVVEGHRYLVCRNAAEAERDAANRSAILDGLRRQLQKGDKALVGNSAYRRYLKTPRRGHFEVDAARVAADARLDGLFVLRTNSKLTPLQAMLRYRELLVVEQLLPHGQDAAPHPADLSPERRRDLRPMSSARSSPWSCARSWRRAARPRASGPSGATSCAISSACRKSRPSRTASASSCAPRPPAAPAGCSGRGRGAAPQHPGTRRRRPRLISTRTRFVVLRTPAASTTH